MHILLIDAWNPVQENHLSGHKASFNKGIGELPCPGVSKLPFTVSLIHFGKCILASITILPPGKHILCRPEVHIGPATCLAFLAKAIPSK